MRVKEDFKDRLRRFKKNNPIFCIHIGVTMALVILSYLIGSFITLSWGGLLENIIESESHRVVTALLVVLQQFITYGIIRDIKK